MERHGMKQCGRWHVCCFAFFFMFLWNECLPSSICRKQFAAHLLEYVCKFINGKWWYLIEKGNVPRCAYKTNWHKKCATSAQRRMHIRYEHTLTHMYVCIPTYVSSKINLNYTFETIELERLVCMYICISTQLKFAKRRS